ncbi:uncharacterized protein LOC124651873 [Lolium rigidum]|uniref:uncharacterized protein LOC124651873 n=1 Tax=Lolium rigidum TaxID=89674 RepID=UPI001F5D42E8|nr:uncharacterized protein LOC124651873 [Lolium rigidum]
MGFLVCVCLLQLLFLGSSPAAAQQPSPTPSPARALDATLQDYAYRALARRPRTGIVYNGTVPGSLAGVAVSALRLRSGSLRRRGFPGYFQFALPAGVVARPRVERAVLVYSDLGNLSDRYYPLPPGYAYLAPVLGLLAYDAANLSAAGLPELSLVASATPILVSFGSVRAVPSGGPAPRCVWFDLDGAPQFRDPEASGNVCAAYRGGHFSIAVNSTEVAPAPASPAAIAPLVPGTGGRAAGNTQAWKIAGTVVGSAAALGLLASALLCLVRYKRVRKLEVMERNSEVGETLRMAQVGRAQAPVALWTRTQPVIESEYAA